MKKIKGVEKKTREENWGEAVRSKSVAEPDPVSEMGLEGSPFSLHPVFSLIIDPEENKLNPC